MHYLSFCLHGLCLLYHLHNKLRHTDLPKNVGHLHADLLFVTLLRRLHADGANNHLRVMFPKARVRISLNSRHIQKLKRGGEEILLGVEDGSGSQGKAHGLVAPAEDRVKPLWGALEEDKEGGPEEGHHAHEDHDGNEE